MSKHTKSGRRASFRAYAAGRTYRRLSLGMKVAVGAFWSMGLLL